MYEIDFPITIGAGHVIYKTKPYGKGYVHYVYTNSVQQNIKHP